MRVSRYRRRVGFARAALRAWLRHLLGNHLRMRAIRKLPRLGLEDRRWLLKRGRRRRSRNLRRMLDGWWGRSRLRISGLIRIGNRLSCRMGRRNLGILPTIGRLSWLGIWRRRNWISLLRRIRLLNLWLLLRRLLRLRDRVIALHWRCNRHRSRRNGGLNHHSARWTRASHPSQAGGHSQAGATRRAEEGNCFVRHSLAGTLGKITCGSQSFRNLN